MNRTPPPLKSPTNTRVREAIRCPKLAHILSINFNLHCDAAKWRAREGESGRQHFTFLARVTVHGQHGILYKAKFFFLRHESPEHTLQNREVEK